MVAEDIYGYLPIKEYCNRHIFYFPVLSGLPNVSFDIRRLHPLKQREIARIWTILPQFTCIEEAWIFGSSLNISCYEKSDTDILIRTDLHPRNWEGLNGFDEYLVEFCKKGYDLIRYERMTEDSICKLIGFERGLKIYERQARRC